jgi:hypothetical protein
MLREFNLVGCSYLDIIDSMLGEQITVGQLTNREGMTMHIHDMMSIVRFNWALRQST